MSRLGPRPIASAAVASLLAASLLAATAFAKAPPTKAPSAKAHGAPPAASASAAPVASPSVSAAPAASAPPPAEPLPSGSCVETGLDNGSKGRRPQLTDSFPSRGTSGYAAVLTVVVEHGKGESVMPRGLDLQSGSEAAKEIAGAGFVIPDQDAGAGARLAPSAKQPDAADRASTTFELPLVTLPKEPGRHVLVVPSLPISVARANGEVVTLCTKPHAITVEDPIASTPDPQPRPNPPGERQREEWTSLKRALSWAAAGVVLGALLAYALYRWNKRPRPVPPPPPPRPPWEVALERLDEVRHAGLTTTGRFADYFDRVNDALRAYLGARYGFDGLESTTDEIVRALRRAAPAGIELPELVAFLQECDLVKFANSTPSPDDCERILAAGEHIVRATTPRVRPAVAAEQGRATP